MGTSLAGLLILTVMLTASLMIWRVTLAGNLVIHSASTSALQLEGDKARTVPSITTAKGDRNNNTLAVTVKNGGATSVPLSSFSEMEVIVQYDAAAQPAVRLTYTTTNPPPAGQWTKIAVSGAFEPDVWNPVETLTVLATLVGATCAPGTVTIAFPNGIFTTSPFLCDGLDLTFHSEATTIGSSTYFQLKNKTSADGTATTVNTGVTGGLTGTFRPTLNSGKFVFPLTGMTQIPAANWDITYRVKRDKTDMGFVWFTNANDISPVVASGNHEAVTAATGSHELETVTGTHDATITGTHDGGKNQDDLTDSTASFVTDGVTSGLTILNIDDGSSATTGTVTATTIVTPLSGGGEDRWDNNDVYVISLINLADLVDASADFLAAGVSAGNTVQNTTDGSSATVTTVDTTTVGGALSGGTDNDWDAGDAYIISLINAICLYDSAADFIASGVTAGDLVLNTTDGSSATVTTVTTTRVCGTLAGGVENDWDASDSYVITLQSAFLRDTTANFISSGVLVGDRIQNTTDGSTSIVTAVTAITVTGVLAGGTDNDWDEADAYIITPLNRWVDLSLASVVPVGATGAVVEVVNTSTTDNLSGVVRGKEDPRDYMSTSTFEDLDGEVHRWQVVKVDSNRVIQGYIDNAAVAFKLLGYTIGSDPVFLSAPPDITPSILNAWTTIDVSNIVASGADGVILLIDSTAGGDEEYSIREVGSAFDITDRKLDERSNTMYFVGLSTNGHFEAYVKDNDINFYLVGYTKGSVIYYSLPIDVTDPTTGSWQPLDADAFGVNSVANGLIFLTENTDKDNNRRLSFRHGDSTDDWNGVIEGKNLFQAAIGISDSNGWKEWMEDDKFDVKIAGYTRLVRMDVYAGIDIVIRDGDSPYGVVATLATDVANTANITSDTWQTQTITFAFPGYTVVDPTDYLEIDLFAEVTTNLSGETVSVDFRIDDPTLGLTDQMNAKEVVP